MAHVGILFRFLRATAHPTEPDLIDPPGVLLPLVACIIEALSETVAVPRLSIAHRRRSSWKRRSNRIHPQAARTPSDPAPPRDRWTRGRLSGKPENCIRIRWTGKRANADGAKRGPMNHHQSQDRPADRPEEDRSQILGENRTERRGIWRQISWRGEGE